MDKLLKIADVQEMTGLSRSSVYRKVAEGLTAKARPPIT